MNDKMLSAACVRICTSIALQVTLPFTTDVKGTGLNRGLASKKEHRNTVGFKFDWFHLVLLYCMILKVYHRCKAGIKKNIEPGERKRSLKQQKSRGRTAR